MENLPRNIPRISRTLGKLFYILSHLREENLKVWWHDATLFVYFSYLFYYIHKFIHSITFIQYIYPSPFVEASLHFLIACLLSGETPPCGAEARIELEPA
jgi:hypothetical protein